MGETENLARMAELVFGSVAEALGWKKSGPTNMNWECVNPQHRAGNSQRSTHPTDVIYTYEDIRSDERVYINVDLKSYKKDSITKTSVRSSLLNLAESVSCANVSGGFRELYVQTNANERFKVAGALFVYNHDQERIRRGEFSDWLDEFSEVHGLITKKNKVFVFEPYKVLWLYTLAKDINNTEGPKHKFHYPSFRKQRVLTNEHPSASLELLFAPALGVIRRPKDQRIYTLYSDGPLDVMGWAHLIDYLARCQIFNSVDAVEVVGGPNAGQNAKVHRSAAVSFYSDRAQLSPRDRELLNEMLSFRRIKLVEPDLVESDIGMTR